jgi:hypothetical protein
MKTFTNSCKGKVRHPSKRMARKEVRRMWLSRRERVFAYKCAFCKFWHVGHRRPIIYTRSRRASRNPLVTFYE